MTYEVSLRVIFANFNNDWKEIMGWEKCLQIRCLDTT